ncbi:MAG TPA: hypothetical protein VM143_12420 [Acidimicrobiales bacterium]|nr:hypothetical protein [Acidimicrobiales bacterium]
MTGTGATLEEHAVALADAIDAVLPAWVERCVRSRLTTVPRIVVVAAREAGEQARAEVGGAVRELLLRDVDDQRVNPLALLRAAVRYPTQVLLEAGATAVERDKFSRERFPDDDFDLSPANWSDIDPSLGELGIAWGAAKAFVHKQRHAPRPTDGS